MHYGASLQPIREEELANLVKMVGSHEGTVNVSIHDFDDAKEESNKAASNDKHLLQE